MAYFIQQHVGMKVFSVQTKMKDVVILGLACAVRLTIKFCKGSNP